LKHNEAHRKEVQEDYVANEEWNQILQAQYNHLNEETIFFEYPYKE